jgi:hypothetical protein
LWQVKEPYNDVEVTFVRLNLTGHFSPILPPFASRGVSRGAPLETNGGTKTGFSTISLGRLQCARRDSAGPTERRRRRSHVCFLKWSREGRSDIVLLIGLHRPGQWLFLSPEKVYFASCDRILLGVRYVKKHVMGEML